MKILLCDDHPVVRDGMRLLLTELSHDVIEAETGEEAVALVDTEQPDLVVMDLHLPGMTGVEATRTITRSRPQLGVLVLTMVADDATLVAALRAGARGYLLKGAGHAEVARAIDAVAHGDVVVSAQVASGLRAGLAPPSSAFPELTRREAEVLELLGRGRSNEQIAAGLFLSVKTVRNNVSAILVKLRVSSRAEAVARVRDRDADSPAG
ncbi:response regulator [Flexivirga alba]|uniref:Response regulator n=1 Tax=Flexivirga alba TaxID=702742 RepID=A0ABW2AH22_9MICO